MRSAAIRSSPRLGARNGKHRLYKSPWSGLIVQLSSIMSQAENEKDAEISSLKNLYEEEKQIVTRYGSFLEVPLLKN